MPDIMFVETKPVAVPDTLKGEIVSNHIDTIANAISAIGFNSGLCEMQFFRCSNDSHQR